MNADERKRFAACLSIVTMIHEQQEASKYELGSAHARYFEELLREHALTVMDDLIGLVKRLDADADLIVKADSLERNRLKKRAEKAEADAKRLREALQTVVARHESKPDDGQRHEAYEIARAALEARP